MQIGVPTGETGSTGMTKLSVLTEEMPADLETPVSAFLKLKDHGAKFLLESVESGTILGRYSFIGVAPASKIVVDDTNVTIFHSAGRTTLTHRLPGGTANPLSPLKQLLDSFVIPAQENQPPLLGGLVGYIGYDLVRYFERIPNRTVDTLGLPLAMFYFADTLLVFDHVQRRLRLMVLTDEKGAAEAGRKLQHLSAVIRSPLNVPEQRRATDGNNGPVSNFSPERFCSTVETVKEYIRAGEVYQLVLSQRLVGKTDADPFTIYRALRMLNPSPYLFYIDFDDVKLIGSSPEALVRLNGRQATVRPIAGTRPRGKTSPEDHHLEKELLADQKERAEHVMLVDLGRNDLGRCCCPGTVKVDELMTVERYSHVMHLTSNVVGSLIDNVNQFDLFRAAFPAGTVTGAPKIRSMQLIEELEPHRRGPYAGAVGYFSLSGDMDWCIAIRTIVMTQQTFFLQAGAGIVADSVPEREYQETRDKIAALAKAIEMAEEGL
ncbi:MAG TPA: anthranilate synthase component I [Candidatus Deferrimicrobium sp.]|nr:anthranilate synthase component I [Candidatus Deferrimicrobium sp.]